MGVQGHSRLGASSCERWTNCPGSIALSESIEQESKPTKYAAEGTVAHSLCERYLLNGMPEVPIKTLDYFGEEVEQDGFLITIDEEMISSAMIYASNILTDAKEKQIVGASAKVVGHALNVEAQFTLSSISEDLGGTNDASMYDERHKKLYVYDFKYGKGILVPAEGNKQLMFYALGVVEKYHIQPETIELVIIQPRCHSDEGPIRRWELSFRELAQFKGQLADAVFRIEQGTNELHQGAHCKFCKAKAICEEYCKGVNEGAQMLFSPVVASPNVPAEQPKAEAMDVHQLARVMDKIPLVKDFIESVEDKVFELLNQGIEVPGYKLVHKRATRQWTDESLVAATFGDVAYAKKIKTPAQLEKEVGKEAVKDYVATAEPGLTVAPESDRREKVIPLVESFNCIQDYEPMDI